MRNVFCATILPRQFAVVMLLTFSSAGAVTQEVADTDVTEPERLLIETSAVYSSDDEDGVRTKAFSLPPTVLRTGLREETELQVEWSGYQWKEVERDTKRGTGDAAVAVKQLLTKESITFPRTAVLVGTSVPVGSDEFTRDRFDPVALGIFSYSFGARVTAAVHTGVDWTTDTDESGDRDTDAAGVYATAFHYSVSPSSGLFLETTGSVPINAPGTPAHSANVGGTHSFHRRVELGVWYGTGISEAAADHQLTSELSVSF